jgi:hypothetical protein
MLGQSHNRLICNIVGRHNIHSGTSRCCPLQSSQFVFLILLTFCLTSEAAPLQQPCSSPGRDSDSRLHCHPVQRRRPCSSSRLHICSSSRLWRQPQTPRHPHFRPSSHLQARMPAYFGLLRAAIQALQPTACSCVTAACMLLLIRFLRPSSRRRQTRSHNSRC